MLGRRFNMMMRRIKKLIALVERQERQKREAELRSLQAHIKPHFLYNTLDTIQWLARKNGAHEVTEVVKSLSRLFRIGLSKGNEIIPLVDEIEHINSYLKIQETRYRSKLNYSIEMDPEIRQCFVLKLILQPIVENAIYHGIKQRRGPGHIHIAVRAADEKTLRLTVTDDGVGMREDILAELQKELQQVGSGEEKEIKSGEISGYGIKNVQARIRLTFGEAYGLSVESAPGKGTTVTILHPLIHESRED